MSDKWKQLVDLINEEEQKASELFKNLRLKLNL